MGFTFQGGALVLVINMGSKMKFASLIKDTLKTFALQSKWLTKLHIA